MLLACYRPPPTSNERKHDTCVPVPCTETTGTSTHLLFLLTSGNNKREAQWRINFTGSVLVEVLILMTCSFCLPFVRRNTPINRVADHNGQATVLYTILYPPLSCTHPPTFCIFWHIFTCVGSTGALVH